MSKEKNTPESQAFLPSEVASMVMALNESQNNEQFVPRVLRNTELPLVCDIMAKLREFFTEDGNSVKAGEHEISFDAKEKVFIKSCLENRGGTADQAKAIEETKKKLM